MKCQHCGREYVEKPWQKYRGVFYCCAKCGRAARGEKNKKEEKAICAECGEEFVMTVAQRHNKRVGREVYCCANCKKYGMHIVDKIQKTMVEKYGVKTPMESEEFKKKNREVWNRKTEEEKNDIWTRIQKKRDTKRKEITKKIRETHYNKQHTELKDKESFIKAIRSIENPTHKKLAMIVGVDRTRIGQLAKIYGVQDMFNHKNTSISEYVVFNMFSGGIANDKEAIAPFEIDIFYPDKKIGVEVNGEMWHNDAKRDKQYHLMKQQIAREKGIKLIHFWESDVRNKPMAIQNIIGNHLGENEKFFARQCVCEVNPKGVSEFLNEYHLQGADRHFKAVGLTHKGELVAVMTFRKSRNNKEVELSRYASKGNVVGGFSKLLANCGIKGEIVSYSDNMISDGDVYKKNGWELVKEIPMDYTIFYKGERRHKSAWRKERLKITYDGYSDDKTEWEMEDEVGALRCWDCGKKKWKIVL